MMLYVDYFPECKHSLWQWWCFVLILAMVLAWALRMPDYGYRGVLLIELLYIFRYDRMKQVVAGARCL